jgi:hypothetical protein
MSPSSLACGEICQKKVRLSQHRGRGGDEREEESAHEQEGVEKIKNVVVCDGNAHVSTLNDTAHVRILVVLIFAA